MAIKVWDAAEQECTKMVIGTSVDHEMLEDIFIDFQQATVLAEKLGVEPLTTEEFRKMLVCNGIFIPFRCVPVADVLSWMGY